MMFIRFETVAEYIKKYEKESSSLQTASFSKN